MLKLVGKPCTYMVKPSLVFNTVNEFSANVWIRIPLLKSPERNNSGVTCCNKMYCSNVLSPKMIFLYSSERKSINFSKAASVGAKTVKGPRDCKASVKSARSIKSAKIFEPKSLSCSGISLGVTGGRVGKVVGDWVVMKFWFVLKTLLGQFWTFWAGN